MVIHHRFHQKLLATYSLYQKYHMITCRLTNKGAKSMVESEWKNQFERSKEQGQKEGGVAITPI